MYRNYPVCSIASWCLKPVLLSSPSVGQSPKKRWLEWAERPKSSFPAHPVVGHSWLHHVFAGPTQSSDPPLPHPKGVLFLQESLELHLIDPKLLSMWHWPPYDLTLHMSRPHSGFLQTAHWLWFWLAAERDSSAWLCVILLVLKVLEHLVFKQKVNFWQKSWKNF